MIYFRWVFIALLMTLIGIQYIAGHKSESFHALILVGIYAVCNGVVAYNLKNNADPVWLRYGGAVLDISMVAFHLYFISSGFDPVAATAAATTFLYPILILLYTFRLNKKLLIFTIIISLFAFNIVYFRTFQSIPENFSQSLSLSPTSHIFKSFYILFIGLLCLYLQFSLDRLIKKQIDANSQLLELQKENLQSQFQMLKQQVNPHFLFNSLNVLTSLIKLDPDMAEKFTEQLSKVYRYVLENKEKDLVPVKTEMEFLRAYIFLLDIRFNGKVIIEIEFDESREDRFLLPLSLQLLIENAIKHNTFSKKSPLYVRLFIDDEEFLNVVNNLQSRETHFASTGIGLKNIMNRYTLISERLPEFKKTDDRYIARIPLLK